MRKTAFAGLLACVCVFAYSPKTNAEAFDVLQINNEFQSTVNEPVLNIVEPISLSTIKDEQATVEQVRPKIETHVVAEGESLDSIARLYNTTWKRLYYKNESVKSPDLIMVGDKITIPTKSEKLKQRTQPTQLADESAGGTVRAVSTVEQPASSEPVERKTQPVATTYLTVASGTTAGNTYTPGQCTWHVKNVRGSSLPNGLGNGDQWYSRAKAMGLATGSEPRVGAAAARKYGNHVAYVTAVHGNGTITVSEMNYNWTAYATRTAVKPASDFWYIY